MNNFSAVIFKPGAVLRTKDYSAKSAGIYGIQILDATTDILLVKIKKVVKYPSAQNHLPPQRIIPIQNHG
jgi:hypothetical protein